MELVLRELERSVIFSEEDIDNIKKFLRRQEQNESSYEIAYMMAQMVNKRVNQALEGIDRKYWWQFKSAFMKFLAADEKKSINKGDIFRLLLTTETELEKSVELSYKWLMLQTRDMVNNKQLRDCIKVLSAGDSGAISAWKRMMMAATTLVVASSVSFPELPRKSIRSESHEISESVKMNHQQVETAIKSERAFLAAQKAIASKAFALETVQIQKKTRVQGLAEISYLEPAGLQSIATQMAESNSLPLDKDPVLVNSNSVKPLTKTKVEKGPETAKLKSTSKSGAIGKRTAVYPTRVVKKSVGEKFIIPTMMAMKPYDVQKLQSVLVEKNSLLAQEPYFTEIISTAEAYGIDPRFIFAIAAQEQGLVKRSNKNAVKIANNPYNIFGSWVRYNTNISDSSSIVCRTILKRMNKWSGIGDPVVWLNKTYAADTNWSKGVKWHYEKLKNSSQAQ